MLKSKRFETPTQITFYNMDNTGQFTKLQTIKKPCSKLISQPISVIQAPFIFNEARQEHSI